MKVFIIDVHLCNGCYNCQLVCKDEHVANDWTPYAKPQPNTGQFWMKVTEKERGTVPKVKVSYTPKPCMHCDNAPCISACSPGAIEKRDDGLVVINTEKCTGCMSCVDVCPYGAIYFNRDLMLAQKCTGCAHLLDNEGWEVPRCVESCPTDALRFGEEKDFKDLIAKAEVMKPEAGSKPRVYYLNLPKRFVAGAVYDPEEDECLEGATVTVINEGNGEKFTATTDVFGDFWFKQLAVGTYSLAIEKDGYLSQEIKAISTAEDVNVGDIALYRKAAQV
jgi:tetrathionate reductase subunit B